MPNRKEYTAELFKLFREKLVHLIAEEDPDFLQSILNNEYPKPALTLPIEFQINGLFSALWKWGVAYGLDLPHSSDYNKDFNEFFEQLKQDGMRDNFQARDCFDIAGLKMKHVHSSNRLLSNRYSISRLHTQI